MQATSLANTDTIYSADCIEFCPFQGLTNIFICGTYQIISEPVLSVLTKTSPRDDDEHDSDDDVPIQSPTKRVGRLLLFQIAVDQTFFVELQRIELEAVLDAKWSPSLDGLGNAVLAVAGAKGQIRLFRLDRDTLNEIQGLSVAEESVLCLSLDWSDRINSTNASSIITSLSNGSLAHLIPSSDGSLEINQTWHAHDFEPWITSWDNWLKDVVWSGGDDCKLKQWDTRSPFRPTIINKNFTAGVTTITSSPHTEHLLAVGSYDCKLRLFDSRFPTSPILTIPVGGGVWRSRFHPNQSRKGDILLACMHDGFKVVRLDEGITDGSEDLEGRRMDGRMDFEGEAEGCKIYRGDGWEIVKRFDDHESLAYGVDWSRLESSDDWESLVASCSFYDHQMHIWRG